ncbi:hypothetical protein COJ07_01060 [Bacillus cereus]|uniref:Acetoacetate decarboxylase n=1 Tax=Bacillus cereus TaxID=1396 RepID=A0A2B0U0J0_BACCE|nr:acetoacetate decarboxylase family protein [Bacillus cereus]PFL25299.1 hypothetical protein COJ07_01060 [Bacillus cereus]PFU38517.1 hypothetical protein COK86_25400 [Bacillus cereus]
MIMKQNKLKGYTLPMTPNGTSSAVTPPPWYFGGSALEVQFETEIEDFKRFLPYPFEMTEEGPIVTVNMVSMTSVSNEDDMFLSPGQSQFKECLIKLRCSINGKIGWYVTNVWVDKDFSLLRGFLLGFGKKIGSIEISAPNAYNPIIGSYRPGLRLQSICSNAKIHISSKIKLIEKLGKEELVNNSLFVIRHFPSAESSEPEVHEVVEIVADQYSRGDIWIGEGDIKINAFNEEIGDLNVKRVLKAKVYNEGFRLIGAKRIYSYIDKE